MIRILILSLLCVSIVQLQIGEKVAATKQTTESLLCKRMFGVMPGSDKFDIQVKSNGHGMLVFQFSTPEEELTGASWSSHPNKVNPGRPTIEIRVVPAYGREISNELTALNEKMVRELENGRGKQNRKQNVELFELPQYRMGEYGFYVVNPSLVSKSIESRKAFAKYMNDHFSKCQYLDSEVSETEFWKSVMDLDFKLPFGVEDQKRNGDKTQRERNGDRPTSASESNR